MTALYHSLWEKEKALEDVISPKLDDVKSAVDDVKNAVDDVKNAGIPELIAEKIAVSVDADADIFDEDLKAPEAGFWIFRILTDTAGYPKVKETVGGSSVIGALNEASNLTANAWYEFWMVANAGDLINIQFSTTATVTIRVFFVRIS